jgi:hypothetical protein
MNACIHNAIKLEGIIQRPRFVGVNNHLSNLRIHRIQRSLRECLSTEASEEKNNM